MSLLVEIAWNKNGLRLIHWQFRSRNKWRLCIQSRRRKEKDKNTTLRLACDDSRGNNVLSVPKSLGSPVHKAVSSWWSHKHVIIGSKVFMWKRVTANRHAHFREEEAGRLRRSLGNSTIRVMFPLTFSHLEVRSRLFALMQPRRRRWWGNRPRWQLGARPWMAMAWFSETGWRFCRALCVGNVAARAAVLRFLRDQQRC
jgi:hypothetical protein